MIGPSNPFSQELHQTKYREENETFKDYVDRYTSAVGGDGRLWDALSQQRTLPAGRQQLAVGRPFDITAFNCFVGGTIEDSMKGIMHELSNSALTMRSGGGCGWDFSSLRPEGDPVKGLGVGARSSGPLSFMPLWNTMCSTIHSAGNRRGAMMGVMSIEHPDILDFINAKRDNTSLTFFNLSVAITDDFMTAVHQDKLFPLKFNGKVYREVRAVDLWDQIMQSNWDWGEPGVLFIDHINKMNPLGYVEDIRAVNPCAEQCLPPFGACLLGSMNLVKYLHMVASDNSMDAIQEAKFNYSLFREDVELAVRAFDKVIDITKYPLPQQKDEALNKRRMGLGVTGMANTLEIMGYSYGSDEYIEAQSRILRELRDTAYITSTMLAEEKGSFPLFNEDWLESGFAKTLPEEIRSGIRKHGLRNGLLLSIAPTGTISLAADNVSSGIEPPYALQVVRKVHMPEGLREVHVDDYAYSYWGVKGKTAKEVTADEHIKVLCAAQKYIDSSVSKTCNVGEEVSYEDFKRLYWNAYTNGAKGAALFRINGKRTAIMEEKDGTNKLDVSTNKNNSGFQNNDTLSTSTPQYTPTSQPHSLSLGSDQRRRGGACSLDEGTGIRSCEF